MTSLSQHITGENLPLLHLLTRKTKLYVSLILGSTVFLILLLLQPFGEITHGFRLDGILRIASYALVVGLSVVLCECLIAPRLKFSSKHRWYQVLLWYSFEIVLVATSVFLCKNAWMNFEQFSFDGYLLVLQRTLSISVFPLLLLAFFLYSQREKASGKVLLTGDKTEDSLRLTVGSLLFLKSEDNYTRIVYHDQGFRQQKLLRGSLSHFEQQLTFPLMRVHRSHIVNLTNVMAKRGNSQGCELNVRLSDEPLKVSRKYLSSFDTAWARLNS